MPVTLKNKTQQLQTFNLTTEPWTTTVAPPTKVQVQEAAVHRRTGAAVVKTTERVIPGALYFLPGEVKADLPDELLGVAEVERALAKGALALLKQVAPEKPSKKAATK